MNRRLIKHLLVDHGLTLADLARRADLNYDRIVRIVHGYRKPMIDEVERMAHILGVPPQELRAAESDTIASVDTHS